jgi:hypothetical protein
MAVPTNQNEYAQWISNFNRAVDQLYHGGDSQYSVASIFIVGNEPNSGNEGAITGRAYAAAFNALWNAPTSVHQGLYLAAGPGLWAPLTPDLEDDRAWLRNVSSLVPVLDGFALHTYATPERCPDPHTDCFLLPGEPGYEQISGQVSFRRYRDFIADIAETRRDNPPVYITEFNTHGFVSGAPIENYPTPFPLGGTNFMDQAYLDVREHNMSSNPIKVHCLCWFVDAIGREWDNYALSNGRISPVPPLTKLEQARIDFNAAFTRAGLDG